jgi:hypothetical protein
MFLDFVIYYKHTKLYLFFGTGLYMISNKNDMNLIFIPWYMNLGDEIVHPLPTKVS